ncbi:RidA family protein [Kutzneria sp. NPDC052558]|uniref:RidA family protein n=1 Tax=Kutzneria sp. NPDC052558 TaxID=3364121 RepID=UPI0037C6E3DC
MTVERLNPATMPPPVDDTKYSHVAIGRGSAVVAIAGQIANDANGDVVGIGDYEAQAEQAFRNFAAALAAAGAGPDDLIKNTIHVVGHRPELTESIFAAGRRAFGGNWPRSASTYLGVAALGHPDWLIEIDGIAVIS